MPVLVEPRPRSAAETEPFRVPPYSIEAEQAVLGGLLIDNAAWDQVADRVVEEDFYRADHRLLFRAIHELTERRSPCDAVTLAEWLNSNHLLEDAGGIAYLGMLAKETPSAANITAYADIVRERSILRQLIRVGTEIAHSGYQPDGRESTELLDAAEQRVFEIAERSARFRHGFFSLADLLPKVMDRLDALFHKGAPLTGVATGFIDFDDKTSGLQPGDLIIVAGRPSMGKTSFAMNVAEQAAVKDKLVTAVFSMEMPAEQLALRLISSLGRVDQHKVRTGRLSEQDWPRLTSVVRILGEAPLFIDETPSLTPTELRARARRLKRERDLRLIVVDYLQLMHVPGTRENRATEISEISRALKALARELHIPVVALSQLNRSLEQRINKRPQMSDLRESGAIEQDADVIVFIYRDEVYHEDGPDKGVAEIIIAKQRNGPTDTIRLTFLGEYTRFENYISQVYDTGTRGSP
jgi:replicative DNA helicase